MMVDGREVRTLRDILPAQPGLAVLFVGKVPAPKSVSAGHYLQGRQGKAFWNRLKEYGLITPTTEFEDDSLLSHGYGITDIAKSPKDYGQEPSPEEYRSGTSRILGIIRTHRPRVVVFLYKKVLEEVLRHHSSANTKTCFGFNPSLEPLFSTRVFVFPMSGIRECTREVIRAAMVEFVQAVGR
ncbi:hypothetical protein FP568_04015 [Pandoraea pnomenusa]|uniref:uracil-DNA glycosylase family protein n=1 Tax=Pandoraea pnomenusa TaxID=93220 RepID=UPI001198B977|nr:uracil-DNA glycosylase family protein [Pandoraea pnomenusa]QDX20507.1 hypothetical protein FP568_04015 [Pandoraea pnomenusa]